MRWRCANRWYALIEVAALVELWLRGLVVDHRVEAVLVGQREVEQLELDGQRRGPAVGGDLDRPLVDTRGPVAPRVDLDPDRLVARGGHANRQPAAPGPGVLGHELHRLPPDRVLRGAGGTGPVDPVGSGRLRQIHVVLDEDLDRPADRHRGVRSGRRSRRSGRGRSDGAAPAASAPARRSPARRPRRSPGRPAPRCARRTAGCACRPTPSCGRPAGSPRRLARSSRCH